MKWLIKWRLRRAERARESARDYLAACQDANERMGGAYLDRLIDAELAERECAAAVADLRRRLEA